MNKTNITGKISALVFSLMMVFAIIVLAAPSALAASERTYTLDADFNEGILANVEHDTVHDQLQLSKNLVSLPLIWVPNSNEGTVSKVDTDTGKELGRYYTGSTTGGSPSRTTVDLMGNVWFGNRNTGTVVKIGLLENGQCKDKNGNGVIETSRDLNNDGNVVGSEILPWGTDECVLYEITGIPGARGIAVDSNNDLWAGAFGANFFKHINGETGAVMATVPTAHGAYGALIDSKGMLWSSEWSTPYVGKLDPITSVYTRNYVPQTTNVYGMGIDGNENLFLSGYQAQSISKYDISSGVPVWVWTRTDPDLYLARGVVVTGDGDVWVAASGTNKVVRLSNDGVIKARITVGAYPTGVSVDKDGKVWVVNYNDGYIKRIDPATNTVDLQKLLLGNSGVGMTHHYGYSDMTGYVSRTITTKTGTWTVDFDSENAGTPWGMVSWNSTEPAGTTVSVRVRSSDDKVAWSIWKDATNSVNLTETPDGRYLQIETTLQITSGDASPVLLDLNVKAAPPPNQPPVAEAGGPYTVDEGSPVVLDGSGSTDPDVGDTLEFAWDLNNDGIYENMGVTIAITPPDGPATMTVGLKVTDSEGAFSTDTAMVIVKNVAPAVKLSDSYLVTVPVTLRIAGQSKVGNSVVLEVTQDGSVISSEKIVRTPGSPNQQEKTLEATVDLSKPYSARLVFDTEEALNGGTPVWVIIDGVETKVTTFNTQKNDPASYHQTYDFNLQGLISVVGKEIFFTGSATDPGTDDMTFDWVFGDSGTAHAAYPWDNGHSVVETVKHTYTAPGSYSVELNVADDDGGVGKATKTVNIT